MDIDPASREAQTLASRLFAAGLGAAELLTAFLGLRLGLYQVLADSGPITAAEVADRAGIAQRYAREWLEQQAASGILLVDNAKEAPGNRLYMLPPGHAEALLQSDSMYCAGPMSILPVIGMARMMPRLIEAYRTGNGVPYREFGEELRGGKEGLNRSIFARNLAGWITSALPDLQKRAPNGKVKIADLACGQAWSSIAIAQAFPNVDVHGFDLDETSIEKGLQNVENAAMSDRVHLKIQDVTDPEFSGHYDVVCIFDALHDMSRPVEALRACGRMTRGAGPVLVIEPNAADSFSAPASETERFLYAISCLHCLPVGLADQPSAATGTVMRPETVRRYATEAGFRRLDIIPIENRFYRLYRLQ